MGTVIIRNQTLKGCIGIAWHLEANQVSGGPKWTDSDRFDIDAKADHPAKAPELLTMLQVLISDRFGLIFHRETRLQSGYALVVTNGGIKIRPTEDGGESKSEMSTGRGRVSGNHISMAKFAETLSGVVGYPVRDMTNIQGLFEIKLLWTPDSQDTAKSGLTGVEPRIGPSLFTAIQEQLGLKLEARKVPVEILLIDHVEKPSEN